MVWPRGSLRRGAATAFASLAGWVLGALAPEGEPLAASVCPPQRTDHRPIGKTREPYREVILEVDGRRLHLKTRRPTIIDVLEKARVRLGPLDEVWPPLYSPVYDGQTITVARVTVREESVVEELPYRTVVRRTRSRWQRYPILKQHGQAGRVQSEYRVVYRDGKPVRRTLLSRRVLEGSVTRIVEVPANRVLSSRGALGGRRVLQMIATAYDPGPKSCGPRATGRTCIGLRAGHGVVAVDPRHIPLRTRLYIEGYGYAIAGDVGSAIKGNRIDLGYATRREALRFGRRRVTVYVLD